MRLVLSFIWLMVVVIVAVAAFEAYAVWRANIRADAILAAATATSNELAPSDLSDRQMEILLTIEDPGFETHNGIDFSSPGQGLTTITQALVKRLFFDDFAPGFAKLEQSLIAVFVVNRRWSKDQQMQLFLNHAYFGTKDGRPIIGFSEGAQAHVSKSFEQLTDSEFTGLVGMLIGPDRLMPSKNPQAYEDRLKRINKLVNGQCAPTGLRDVLYENC